jgi:hypothetical protein
VRPHITAEEAKKSVQLLEECELIKKDKSGKYVLTENSITTGDRTSKLALIAEEDQNSDKVFQLEFAMFPVGGK